MISQTLASLLLHMPRRSLVHVHSILLQMIRQDFPIPCAKMSERGSKADAASSHIWEVRHAGLLGVKYEVAVRSDLFEASFNDMKQEEDTIVSGKSILRDVVDAAILG